MKARILLFLMLALIVGTSVVIVGCGGGSAAFTVSGCTVSPNPVDAGVPATISAVIAETAGVSGTYNATLTINGAVVDSKSVDVTAKGTQTVTFTYTPPAEGTYNASIGNSHCTLTANKAPVGYYSITYAVTTGSRIALNYSLNNNSGIYKAQDLTDGDGTIVILVNKTAAANGSRDIIVTAAGWQLATQLFTGISGFNMNLTISLSENATGVLYTRADIGNVDMSSVSSTTTTPQQIDTRASGNDAPAGSMWFPAGLAGDAKVLGLNIHVNLPFGLTFTTGNTTNIISISGSQFNGATLSSEGAAFAKAGTLTLNGQSLPDYVGTSGTITAVGTGNCLGITLANVGISFQTEIKLVLRPVSVQ